MVALLLAACPVAAQAPVLKIKGEARLDATAGWLDGRLVVSGVARDDTGRALPGAELRVKGLSARGSPVPLPAGSACSPLASADSMPRAAGEERAFRADRQGRFCVDFAGASADSIEIRLVDGRGFIDSSSRRIEVDRSRRGIELRFVDPPTALDLDAPAHEVELSARAEPPLAGNVPPLDIELVAREQQDRHKLLERACPLGGSTRLRFETKALGQPGPLDLVASFAGTESLQPAEAALRVPRTARVEVRLAQEPEPSDPESGIELALRVSWSRGVVGAGSVEARLHGETVGIAEVEQGTARLTARFARPNAERAELSLHYLPNEPWWIPAPPRTIEVALTPRNRFASLVWMAGLVAIASWLLAGWRRPVRDPEHGANPSPPRMRSAAVVLVEPSAGGAGWLGSVRDAHDEVAIGGAHVTVVVSGASGTTTLARAVSDERGEFALGEVPRGEGARFVVSAPWHATLSSPLPQPGRLMVDLVTRRRQLVTRFLGWAGRDGRRGPGATEPTPGEVRKQAEREQRPEVASWARAVEAAAYGPEPVDEPAERRVLEREPPAKTERH